jgi:hypothetical protein
MRRGAGSTPAATIRYSVLRDTESITHASATVMSWVCFTTSPEIEDSPCSDADVVVYPARRGLGHPCPAPVRPQSTNAWPDTFGERLVKSRHKWPSMARIDTIYIVVFRRAPGLGEGTSRRDKYLSRLRFPRFAQSGDRVCRPSDDGAGCRSRTDDLPLTRRVLYQLS